MTRDPIDEFVAAAMARFDRAAAEAKRVAIARKQSNRWARMSLEQWLRAYERARCSREDGKK